MAAVWSRMLQYYRDHGIVGHFCNIAVGLFTSRQRPNAKYPKMRGKACEVKLLGCALRHVWNHYSDAASVIDGQIRLLLACSVRMEDILSDNSHLNRLQDDVWMQLMETCEQYLVLSNACHDHFARAGMQLFHLTTKTHLLWHACHMARWLHPRFTWCYSGEDYMLHSRRLGQACLRGTKKPLVVVKMTKRWVRGFTFRMQRQALSKTRASFTRV